MVKKYLPWIAVAALVGFYLYRKRAAAASTASTGGSGIGTE